MRALSLVLPSVASTSGRTHTEFCVARQPARPAAWHRPGNLTAESSAAAAVAAGWQQRRRHLAVCSAPADSATTEEAEEEEEELEEYDEFDAEQWVEVGKIGPPHGVRGEMKVQPLTDFPEDRLATPGTRWVQAPAPKIGRRQAPTPEEVELEWGRSMISKGNEVWLVKLEGIESPEEAATLRGHTLLIPASAREPLEDEDEFYVQDLVGLRVFLQSSGQEIGHVADVFDGTGTHDVLRIQMAAPAAAAPASNDDAGDNGSSSQDGPRHVLLPFAKAMVPVVDLKAGRMEITPPEGLLELAAPSNMRRPRRENRGRRERRRTRPKGQNAADAGGSSSGGSPASSE